MPGEREYTGRGVAFCPHCDGPFYKDRPVAVVGGGNSGVEAAIDLAGICSHVTVLEFMDSLKADVVLQDKLRSLPNVVVFTSVQTTSVEGDGSKVTAVRLKDRASGEERTIPLDGVFVQIGLSANSDLVRRLAGAEPGRRDRYRRLLPDGHSRRLCGGRCLDGSLQADRRGDGRGSESRFVGFRRPGSRRDRVEKSRTESPLLAGGASSRMERLSISAVEELQPLDSPIPFFERSGFRTTSEETPAGYLTGILREGAWTFCSSGRMLPLFSSGLHSPSSCGRIFGHRMFGDALA